VAKIVSRDRLKAAGAAGERTVSAPRTAAGMTARTAAGAAARAATGAAAPVKILIASHSHPQLSRGGAEIAAFQLFHALNGRTGYESWFLGCVRDPTKQKLGATMSQPYSEREYLYAAGAFDWFKFANQDRKFPGEFRDLLLRLQPQIVHFHHYLNFGVEAFLQVREVLPRCRIAVTLHEYLALCHHYGQMITKQNRTLCYEASPARCAECFTDIPASDFFLRNLYIKRFFELVDHFIAPSKFLAERYIAWGIPKERISVIENVVAATQGSSSALERHRDRDPLRVGFFGQISLLKGINVLFDAAELMLERKIDNIVFEIYGDYSGQPNEFQQDFLGRLGKAGRNVRFQGAYDQFRVDRLMQSMDLILVPSIWWENSPLVIQEALRNRRPVICSDIGGMAEKVRDGIDGFHFPVGSSLALVALLARLAESRTTLTDVANTMNAPATVQEMTDRYLQFYSSLAAG
jgi:glycosyltransferase involved in cell wall biosynthesis